MMITILSVLGLFLILFGISGIQAGFGVETDKTLIVKVWRSVFLVLSGFWSWIKKSQDKLIGTIGGIIAIGCGVLVIMFGFWKQESDMERATGTLGMSRLDWQFVSREARKADGHRTTYERKWLGDKLEIQHSEMQRHVSDPKSTLIRVYLPGPVDGSLFFEVSPNGETKEWRMPPTPPIFPKK